MNVLSNVNTLTWSIEKKMNELENLVFRNGRFYDTRTNNRVFIKPPAKSEVINPPTSNDKPSSEVITPPEPESGSEGLKLAVKPIVRRPRKPKA